MESNELNLQTQHPVHLLSLHGRRQRAIRVLQKGRFFPPDYAHTQRTAMGPFRQLWGQLCTCALHVLVC